MINQCKKKRILRNPRSGKDGFILCAHLITFLTLITNTQLVAQTNTQLEHQAPSLQVGLEGMNFSRGTLDAELIMQMVAEKQSEVGLRIVQNQFLKKMASSGGAFYSFADNIIRDVVSESDINVISKKLLENTVNIVFTYTYADYYVRRLSENGSDLKQFNNFARSAFGYPKTASFKDAAKDGLNGVKNEVLSATGNDNSEATEFIAVIVDMASEAIRENPVFKDLGILQVSHSVSYNHLNKYLKYQANYNQSNNTISTLKKGSRNYKAANTDFDKAKNKYDASKPIFEDMKCELQEATAIIGLLKYTLESNSYRLNISNILKDFTAKSSGYRNSDAVFDLQEIIKNLRTSMDGINQLLITTTDTFKIRSANDAIQRLSSVNYYLKKAQDYLDQHPIPSTAEPSADAVQKKAIINSDIVYTLYADIIPTLKQIAPWDPRVLEEVDRLEHICRFIQSYYVKEAKNPILEACFSAKAYEFLSLVSRAYEFDKANTFSKSVNLLSDFEDLFPDANIKTSLSFINTYIRDFVAISRGEDGKEYVHVNVESLISKLSAVKYDRMRRFSGLFTVGVNSIFFDGLQIGSGDEIYNYSFVSEKIGFKIKIIDNHFWKTRSPGERYKYGWWRYVKEAPPKEPVISNWHLLFYGSGILYNIVNTGTSADFNSPIFGAGTGLTFFNNLDINFTAGIPLLKNADIGQSFKNVYYGIGFEVSFSEYFKRLGEKRRINENKKIIAETMKN